MILAEKLNRNKCVGRGDGTLISPSVKITSWKIWQVSGFFSEYYYARFNRTKNTL